MTSGPFFFIPACQSIRPYCSFFLRHSGSSGEGDHVYRIFLQASQCAPGFSLSRFELAGGRLLLGPQFSELGAAAGLFRTCSKCPLASTGDLRCPLKSIRKQKESRLGGPPSYGFAYAEAGCLLTLRGNKLSFSKASRFGHSVRAANIFLVPHRGNPKPLNSGLYASLALWKRLGF